MAKQKDESSKGGADSKNQQIEKYLNQKYEFRFNTIKRYAEYRDLSSKVMKWIPVDKYRVNTYKREMDALNITTSPENIWTILESEFADAVNPIKDYFDKLPAHDNQDHINVLCSTVKVIGGDKWYEYLKKWLVGVVSNVYIEAFCSNHLCLVLTGTQGKFKTTWLDNLCPKPLREHYIFTGKIDPNGKDILTYISEYLFINVDDQLRQLNKQDENQLKNLITTPSVKYRRPYDRSMSYYPHTASFMASVNGNDFLTDPTGNRRFLPFEVMSIDIDKAQAVDMDKVYSQALQLFKAQFQYWFDDRQVEELHENNQRFQVTTVEEELLLEYFEVPAKESGSRCGAD